MIRDERLEHSPLWHVTTGPDIGGPTPFVPPDTFTIYPPSASCDWMQVAISGKPYTDGMAALRRPFLPNMGAFALEFDILTDGNARTRAQALEADIRMCFPSGYNYNGSWQINYERGGEIQVYAVKPAMGWVSTGLKPGRYAPNVPHHVRLYCQVDDVKHTFSLLTTEIDGVIWKTPEMLLNVPGELLHWIPGNYVQLQSDLAFAGGAFTVMYKEVACVAL